MESALYGIFTLVGEVSEISLVRCAHSFDFRYFTNSCENPVRARFPWSNLYFRDGHLQNRLVAIQLWIDAFMIWTILFQVLIIAGTHDPEPTT